MVGLTLMLVWQGIPLVCAYKGYNMFDHWCTQYTTCVFIRWYEVFIYVHVSVGLGHDIRDIVCDTRQWSNRGWKIQYWYKLRGWSVGSETDVRVNGVHILDNKLVS
jgi:hypothetical protein